MKRQRHPESGRVLAPWEFTPEPQVAITSELQATLAREAREDVPETAKEREARLESPDAADRRDWEFFYSKPLRRCRYCKVRARLNVHRKTCPVSQPTLF